MGIESGQILNQIAMSVTDLRRTHQWYLDVFGFACAGGTEAFKGWITEKVQGVPGARTTCWWLIDQQDYFQLELFEFERPHTRPLPSNWSRADIGYSTLGIHVGDFDAILARAAQQGTTPLTEPLGSPGQRRVCLRDPEGVLIEVMEQDIRATRARARPRPEVPCTVRFVTATVPDLGKSRAFFVDGMGLAPADEVTLHGPEHEALWGLAGAESRSLLLWAGDMLLELVEYTHSHGRDWPANYYISDQGLLNIAFGYRNRRDHQQALRAARSAGASPNWITLDVINWGVVYVNDPQGFSIELLYVRPYWDRQMGFLPALPDQVVERSLHIDASTDQLWQRITDHAGMKDWWPCSDSRLLSAGEQDNGPGAVREIRSGRQVFNESIVAWEPGRRLDYRLNSGAPVKYYLGRVVLESGPEPEQGTTVHYTIRFCAKVPGTGWLLERLIGGRVDKGLSRLKSLAEESNPGTEETALPVK